MPRIRNFTSIFLMGAIAVILVLCGLGTGLWIHERYAHFREHEVEIREDFIRENKNLARTEVRRAVAYIEQGVARAERLLTDSVRERTENALEIARNMYDQYKDDLPRDKIRQRFADAIRPLRFNQGRGYYFVVAMDGTSLLSADSPEIEGSDLLDLRSMDGKSVVRDMIALAGTKGEGFYAYDWTMPGQGDATFRKISYIKYFKPFDCLIGTGEYVEPTTRLVQDEVLDWLVKVRFGQAGYLFGSTYDGKPLFSSGEINRGGPSIWNLTDPNGVKIFQEQRQAVNNPGGGFVEYTWKKLHSDVPSPKIAFVRGVPQWRWIIGTGFYLDEVEGEIAARKNALDKDLAKGVLTTALMGLGLMALALTISLVISRWLKRQIHVMREFFSRAASDKTQVDVDLLPLSEFKDLAMAANRMVAKQAEAEALLEAVVDQSPIPMALVSAPDMVLRRVNAACLEQLGTEDEPSNVGRPLVAIKPTWRLYLADGTPLGVEDLPLVRAARGEATHNLELKIVRKDGRTRWELAHGVPVRNEDGQVIAGFVMFPDITKRKEAEEALKAGERRLRQVVAKSPYPMCIVHCDTLELEYLNESFNKVLGLTLDDVRSVDELLAALCFDQAAMESVREQWTGVFAGPPEDAGSGAQREWRFRGRDGEAMEVECRVTPLGEIALVAMVDLTAHKKLQASLLKAKEAADVANRTKSEFLANMSHEIRTPLNGIMGMLQVLARCEMSKEQEPLLANAFSAAKRLAALLGDILDLSRIEAGKIELAAEPFVLDGVLDSTRDLFRKTANDKSLTLDLSMDRDIPAMLVGDPARLTQVLFNLVGNAVKYTREGKVEVVVSAVPAPRPGRITLILTVRDTGIGIPENLLGSITEAFTQAESSITRNYEGAGLGLFIVKRLVEFMEGHMIIHSVPDQGTEVEVAVPFAAIDDPPAREPEAAPRPIPLPCRVLLVEDDRVNRLGIEQLLRFEGCEVTWAANGQEALDRLAQDDFHIVLMDVRMPVMDGLTAIRAIRTRPDLADKAAVPIIALTALATSADKEEVSRSGADAFVTKPVALDDLLQAMAGLLS